jgi:lipopolysaccharide export system permease protein
LNLIDRYLLREWLKMLVLVLGATLGLLLLQAMYEDFSDLINDDAGVADIVVYYGVKLPSYLSVVLPLSLLVSLLYTLGQMHRNNEITAMRAAGMGLFRITRSIWLTGLLLCGVTWYFNATVIPWSVEESRSIRENLEFRREAKGVALERVGMLSGVTFNNQREGRMWYFNRYSQFTHRGYGLTLVQMDKKRHELFRLLASEAWYDQKQKSWVLYNGREIWMDPANDEVIRTETFKEKSEKDFTEDPAMMLIFDVKPQNLSFTELRRIIDYFEVDNNPKATPYAVRYYSVLADTLGPLIIIALAIPFAVTGVRVNPVVGVSKSLGLFLLYFVLVKTSTALGGRDIIPALWAALLPIATMLLVGLGFFARVR